MSNTLNIALLQIDLLWESPEQNRQLIISKINEIEQKVDLIILPEMFTTGFTMNAEKVAETMTGKTLSWMVAIATKKQVAITGSLVIKENNKYYNRLIFVFPDGNIKHYDKRHTFTLAGENKVYTVGSKKLIVNYNGWKICPLICYDLRFPVWARNTDDYHLLIYVANWPKPRINAWNALLRARAIENMSYCVGVNRTGFDYLKNEYTGNSAVYDFLGNKMVLDTTKDSSTTIVEISIDILVKAREKLQFLNDRDPFNLTPVKRN